MWRENSAWIVEGGVVVLPTQGFSKSEGKVVGNNPHKSYNDYLKTTNGKNGAFVTYNGNQYKILGHIHSHPHNYDAGPTIPNDFTMLKNTGIPIFTIGPRGIHQGLIFNGEMNNAWLGSRKMFYDGTFSIRDFID